MKSAATSLNLVVMGVSGCGKSSVGAALAAHFGGNFLDGDDLHPAENVERMSKGIPLRDEDRMPWLTAINHHLHSPSDARVNVVACSALKRSYRDVLSHNLALLFVHLQGDFALIESRSKARQGHFMNLALLQSQFDTLEPLDPSESAVVVSIEPTLNEVVDDAIARVTQHPLFVEHG